MNQSSVESEAKLADLIYHLVLLKKWRDEHCLGESQLFDDEVDMLGVIEIHPGIIISNLAKYLGISLSTTTGKVEKLVGLSYIVQNSVGRKLPIYLTKQGEEALSKAKLAYLHQVVLGPHLVDGKATSELHELLVEMNKKVLEKLLDPFKPIY